MANNAQNYSLVMAFDVDRAVSKTNMETALSDLQKLTKNFNVSLQVDTANFDKMMKSMTEDIEGAIEKNTRKIISTYTSALRGARKEHRDAMQSTLKEIEQMARDSKKKIQNIFSEPIKIKTNLQSVSSAEAAKTNPALAQNQSDAKGVKTLTDDLNKDIKKMYKDIADVERDIEAMGNRVKKSTAKKSQGELKGFAVEYTDSVGSLKKTFYEMRGVVDETTGDIAQMLMQTNEQVVRDYKRIEAEQEKLLKRQKEVQKQIDGFKQNRFNNNGDRTDLEKDMKKFEKTLQGADLYDTKSLKEFASTMDVMEEKTKNLGEVFEHKTLRKGLQNELSQLMTITAGLEDAGVKLGKSKQKIFAEFDKKISGVNTVDEKKLVNAEIRRMKAAFNQVPAMLSRMDWVENNGLVDEKRIKSMRERIRKTLTPENNAVIGVGINDLAAEVRVMNDAARYQKRINDMKKDGRMADKEGVEYTERQVSAMQQSLEMLKNDPTSKRMAEFKKEYGEMLRGQTGVDKEFLGKKRGMIDGLDDIRSKYKLLGADVKRLDDFSVNINSAKTIKEIDEIRKKYSQLKREMSERYRGGVGQKEDIASASSMFAQRESLLAEVRQSYSRGMRGRYKEEYKQIQALAKEAEDRLSAVRRGDKGASLIQSITDDKGNTTYKNWTTQMDEIQARTVRLRNNMKELRGATDTVGYSMRTAFEKFPVWMLASSAFYAPIQGLTSMYNIIMQVDTQMTNLKRVMDADTNFDEVLAGNIEMAKELGKTVTDINYAMENFAKSGNYSEEQLNALTKTSVIASNVSDLSAQEMSETLITGMSVFNVEAEKSMMIIDKLNEVKCLPPFTGM
ncbi:hypothetical protein EVJ32_05150 [Exiguobacterium sp. SH5S4]|uniref:hypothetical protein n=1 Tax=Exiguobacterium sp. SH5S4 TaxID=2510961 RepID=UPI0010388D73|nr:hypothetical protein [Exiguobacterium sp. SH5S4]TCI26765.1 hypothetical protein EVJ32_05150 [Exiguobacterium sp. SH5S4]